MKIILAPSKTRNSNFENLIDYKFTTPAFIDDANFIANIINKKSPEELSVIMKIKKDLLNNTYANYINFDDLESFPAIHSYSGTVFNEIEIDKYNSNQVEYLASNVRILSALYGVLRPFDKIKNYRLDMNTKVLENSNYQYWKNRIDKKSLGVNKRDDELVINLASSEFSKMLNVPFINIEFKERVDDNKHKIVGIYAKKARGKMVNYLITNEINNIKGVCEFNIDDYIYNPELSNDSNIVFTR